MSDEEGELVPNSDALLAAFDAEENQSLRVMCAAHGITRDKFARTAHTVLRLDLFQSPLRDLRGAQFFPNLTDLCVMQQRYIDSINWLSACTALESLWISECGLRKIEGLDACRALKRLHLHCNQISRIENLSALTNLEVLWLSENHIEDIRGLDALTSLRVLWLARNRIRRLGTGLDALVSLEEINLADNRIGFFKELLHLGRLPSLKSVCFSDPHFGDNPVCNLCNYQTYVLYHLRHLSALDTLVISDEAKQLAEATYMKKRMYYNMRIKTLKRNTTNVVRKAKEARQAATSHAGLSLNALLRQSKDIERVVDEHAWLPPPAQGGLTEAEVEALKAKFKTLEAAVAERTAAQTERMRDFEGVREEVVEVAEENIARLVAELETGGNIRLEDGTPSLVWHSSCIDLVRSRTFAPELAAYGIVGARVTRVTRVHNRFLRNRFERRMHALLGAEGERDALQGQPSPGTGPTGGSAVPKVSSTPSAKRSLEYLFYAEPPALSRRVGAGNELMRVVEEGFRSPEEYRTLQQHAATRLTNSLAAADAPRIRAYLNAHALRTRERRAAASGRAVTEQHIPPPTNGWDGDEPLENDRRAVAAAVRALADGELRLPPGRLVVAKVFMGECRQEGQHCRAPTPDELGPDGSPRVVSYEHYEGVQSVYRQNPSDPKQREWFLMDSALVLPEYVVEFEYETAATREAAAAAAAAEEAAAAASARAAAAAAGSAGSDHGSESEAEAAVRPAEPGEPGAAVPQWVSDAITLMGVDTAPRSLVAEALSGLSASGRLSEQEAVDLAPLLRPLLHFMQRARVPPGAVAPYDAECEAVLAVAPVPPRRERLLVASEKAIFDAARTTRAADIMFLNLHGNSLRQVDAVAGCTNLRVLVLSFNEIHSIDCLSNLGSLERLEIGFNLVKRLDAVRGLPRLEQLEAPHNLLHRAEDLVVFAQEAPALRQIDLRHNAVCEAKAYRVTALRAFTRLEMLDGRQVTAADHATAREDAVSVTRALLRAHATGSSLGTSTHSQSTSDMMLRCRRRDRTGTLALDLHPGQRVEGGAQEETHSGHASGTRQSSVGADKPGEQGADAEDWWRYVEAVDLSHQRLRRIQNLQGMTRLTRASFADNELSRIEGLEECVALEELSLEENRILKLEGLSTLTRLRKLDLGKNRLCRVEGVGALSRLTQLSLEDNEIASLSGLQHLVSLMELYIGNNRISTLKEVQFLKDLPKLIILDLSGNPLCRNSQYRLYCVYYLRKLKVLDGVGVDGAEQQSAREQYSGKLTTEFLVDKIGHRFFEHIRELDLSACRIREIESLNGREFCNLRDLNLERNLVRGLNGLRALPLLTTLRLGHNRIEGLSVPPVGDPVGLGAVPNVEELTLGHNHISSPAALHLHALSALRVLHLQGNAIVRLEGIAGLRRLRELCLDKNKIKGLEPGALAGLDALEELRLEENGLRSLQHISGLPSLHTLFLGYNRVSDLSDIDYLHDLPRLEEIALNNNAVARKQMYRPTLVRTFPGIRVIDGQEVSPEERDRVEMMYAPDAGMPLAGHPGYGSVPPGVVIPAGRATGQGATPVTLGPGGMYTSDPRAVAAAAAGRAPGRLSTFDAVRGAVSGQSAGVAGGMSVTSISIGDPRRQPSLSLRGHAGHAAHPPPTSAVGSGVSAIRRRQAVGLRGYGGRGVFGR